MRGTAAKVARNVAWLGAGEVALKGALFTAGVLVARGFGPAGMGVFTVAYGAALVAMHLLAGGQVEVLIRETARHHDDGPTLFLRARSYQRWLVVFVVPLAVAGAMLVPVSELRWTLLAFIPYAVARGALITAGAIFKGLDRMDVEVRARALELAVALPCVAVLAFSALPVWGTGLAFTAGGTAGFVWIRSRLRELPAAAGGLASRSMLVREGLPFLGLSMLHQLVGRADSFLLAGLGVPQAEIGRYGVGTAPVQGAAATAQVLAVASYPSLARVAAAGTLRARLAAALAVAGAALGSGLALALFTIREPLVRIVFGPEFAGSAVLLGVLAWGLPATCASMLAGTVLAATRRQRWPLASQSVLLLGSVAANLVVIPRWGVAGCAAVAVSVYSVSAVVNTTLAMIAAVKAAPAPAEVVPLGTVVEGSG